MTNIQHLLCTQPLAICHSSSQTNPTGTAYHAKNNKLLSNFNKGLNKLSEHMNPIKAKCINMYFFLFA